MEENSRGLSASDTPGQGSFEVRTPAGVPAGACHGGSTTPPGEWRLLSAQNFLAQSLAVFGSRHRFEQLFTTESLHFLESIAQ